MRIFLSFLLFSELAGAACDFKPEIQKVYSLSGPITTGLSYLGLLNKPQVKGISVFYPATEKEFAGEFIPGGLFLSPESKKKFADSTVFFDESREMRKLLKGGVGVETRNLLPLEVTELVISHLKPIVRDCEKEFANFRADTLKEQQQISEKIKAPLPVVFFLGEFKGERPPEMVMVNDGVVKWLIQEKKIKTYPSELSYINWSAKILHALPEETYLIGIKDSGKEMEKKVQKHTKKKMTVIYPGALIPGIDQLKTWHYWLKNI